MPDTPHESAAKTRRFLVVDDDDNTRFAITALLRLEGFHVEAAATPLEALARLELEQFDVLVTDQVMPEMTGLDLIRLARELQPELRCFVVSGQEPPDGIDRSALRWIGKPLDVELFLAALAAP